MTLSRDMFAPTVAKSSIGNAVLFPPQRQPDHNRVPVPPLQIGVVIGMNRRSRNGGKAS